GGDQVEPVEHAGNRRSTGARGFALADIAGNAQRRLVDGLQKAETGAARQAKQRDRAELAVDDADATSDSGRLEFAARPVDFELGDRLSVLGIPAQHVLAATFGMPENLISSCFIWKIVLIASESRNRAAGDGPVGPRCGFGGVHRGQLVPEIDAE